MHPRSAVSPLTLTFLVCGAVSIAGCGASPGSADDPADDSADENAALSTPVTIIQDGFNGTNNAPIAGRKPTPVNLPGGAWTVDTVTAGGPFDEYIDTEYGKPEPAMHFFSHGHAYGSAAISLLSHGTYTKPTHLVIKADTRENASSDSAGILLGFYSVPPKSGTNPIGHFTGLALHTHNGSLDLVENGVTRKTIAYTGAFSPTAFHTLSYAVNTTTGAISGVSLTGSTSVYSFSSTAFTNAATGYAGVGVEQGPSTDACSYIDNFIVKS
jgi:hypothetical protein